MMSQTSSVSLIHTVMSFKNFKNCAVTGPESIAILEINLISFTSVLVTWSPPQEPNGVITMYELTYRLFERCPVSENITNRFNYTIFAEANSRITGIRMRAYTSVGPGPFIESSSITLSPRKLALMLFLCKESSFFPLAIVMNVQVRGLTATSVEVSWDRITDIPGITEYTVYYAPVSSSRKRQDNEQSVTVPSTENSVVISGLESTVEYQYQVTAVAMFGGRRLEGDRSPLTDSTSLRIMEPGDGGVNREGSGDCQCEDSQGSSV